MLNFIAWLTGLAGPISVITSKIAELGIAKAKAQTDYERARITREIEEAHDRRAILVAEAGNRVAGALNASMRFLLALGPMVFLLKVFAWDKTVGPFYKCVGKFTRFDDCYMFNTDNISTQEWAVVVAVVAFYFGYNIIANFRK